MSERKVVWVTHQAANTGADRYCPALEEVGFRAEALPLIETIELNRIEALAVLKLHAEALGAVAFTSATAVRFAAQLLQNEAELRDTVKRLPCFAIEPATFELAAVLGFNVEVHGARNAAALASAVARERPAGVVLFPCSLTRRDELPLALEQQGIEVLELPLYSSDVPRPEALHGIRAAWRSRRPDVVLFFSPSAVMSATGSLRDLAWNETVCVALGSTTAEALSAAGLEPRLVLEEPSPEAAARSLKGFAE